MASTGSDIKHLDEHDLRYIIVDEPGDHADLFGWVNINNEVMVYETQEKALNDVAVSFLEYTLMRPTN